MNLSQQIKPYPRTMYHVNYEKPKVVNSKAEEAEASTKGWIVSYIYKEYPKWVDGKIVQSRIEEDRLLAEHKPLIEVALDAIERGPTKSEEIPPPIDIDMSGNLATGAEFVGADPWLDGIETEIPSVTKETQVEGQDTAIVEKPKKFPGRPKKIME